MSVKSPSDTDLHDRNLVDETWLRRTSRHQSLFAAPQMAGAATLADAYFSADVETDGPIPGPFSMLSFALVYAGTFDGETFDPETSLAQTFYTELRPISASYEQEALDVNGIDRELLSREGELPANAMSRAAEWVRAMAHGRRPILVAYPLSFDWTFLYWYFVAFSTSGSPFNHSGCYDLKTAFATKAHVPVSWAGREQILPSLRSPRPHTHHALDDAREQAELFIRLFTWSDDGRG
jgi:hypothetical protein